MRLSRASWDTREVIGLKKINLVIQPYMRRYNTQETRLIFISIGTHFRFAIGNGVGVFLPEVR